VARGDFSQKLPAISSKDEIAVLTDTFNDMAGQLQDTIRQVENERNKLGTLFLHMTDGVVAFSWEGTLIHSNPAAEKMLQRKLGAESRYEELFGEMVTLDDVLQEPDYLARDVQVGSRDLNMLLAPFDRQRQGGVLVVVHDVTEQRRNEAMHREFVANVSHELRTPLTNIRSYAETLVEDADNIAPAIEKKFLNVILSESDRMTNIVQDLLTLSRFDSGYADLALTRFSFGKSVNDLYQAVYMEAQRHNHTLKLELEPNLPGIVADKDRIFQVMMNVVSNAIKYTPDGGCITLRAGQRAGWVWFEVDDNGIGIPMQDREHIFDRFYRVDKARSRQSGGTGLGLSIAKEIVNRHEGVLTLRDKEEPGLAIRLELKLEGPNDG